MCSSHQPANGADSPMPVTALAVAIARGAQEVNGSISGAEFNRVGIPFMGGCQGCGATLAAYNAYPSTTGYWRCDMCIGDMGFATVEAFEAAP